MSNKTKFIIDVNLPYRFSLWHHSAFIHVRDIDDEWTDREIWEHAKTNNLTIITKDADFSHLILFSEPPPKVIQIRFGNLKFKEFFDVMTAQWPTILELNSEYKLVNVFSDRIEGVK